MLKHLFLQDALASFVALLALVLTAHISLCTAKDDWLDTDLVGTWTSKTNKVKTGSGFYDPKKDEFIEPSLPGMAYSFSKDGHYEEALYRAIANPKSPDCPKAVLQFQHGEWYVAENGSLILEPIKVDGRQQVSDPCKNSKYSTYSRYNQTELFKKYEVSEDKYHKKKRLDLYNYDGTPVNKLLRESEDPDMLPTSTLNPVHTPTSTDDSYSKRGVLSFAKRSPSITGPSAGVDAADIWWWLGVVMTSLGGLSLLYSWHW